MVKRQEKMAREHCLGLPKSKAIGIVKYVPFEDLDEASFREIQRFQVHPFGKIHENCKHIPYNSGKKDFFEKTGRESFEGESTNHQLVLPPRRRN
jgi:hypothetical protein